MSQWTHVAGIIRLDGGGPIMGMNALDESMLINQMLSNSHPPSGSEGPIQYSFHHHGQDETIGNMASSSAYRGAIVIWGDLRNFGDDEVDKIRDWFSFLIHRFNGAREMPFWVREAVLSIRVEYKNKKIILVDDNEKGIVEVKAPIKVKDI